MVLTGIKGKGNTSSGDNCSWWHLKVDTLSPGEIFYNFLLCLKTRSEAKSLPQVFWPFPIISNTEEEFGETSNGEASQKDVVSLICPSTPGTSPCRYSVSLTDMYSFHHLVHAKKPWQQDLKHTLLIQEGRYLDAV